MSTYLGSKGYTIYKNALTLNELNTIKKELTVKPYVPKNSMIKVQSFPVFRESKKKIYVPRFYGIECYGPPEEIRINDGNEINLDFKGELRDYQKPIVEKFVKHAKNNGCGLLEIHTGGGKTVLALNIISKLKKKTLIVVHKEFLLRQWVERIEQFLPNAKVGKIQGSTIDVEDKDIVIGMLQSLSMKEYDKKIFDDFGFTIFDESHHLLAQVFSKALFKIVTKYMLGLSATMERKDGLTKVFKMFIGEVVVKKERPIQNNVIVKSIEYFNDNEKYSKTEYNWKGQTNYVCMIKKLCEFKPRMDFILKVLIKILKDNDNQQIMIIGHNKSLLIYLHNEIKKNDIAPVGYYLGGMKAKDLKESESKKVIIATYAMAEEGLYIKSLSTLLMASPKVNVTQAVGRILRKADGEKLIIDIVDQHPIFERHWKKRKTWYNKRQFKVLRSNNNDFNKDIWFDITGRKRSKKKPNNISQKNNKNIHINTEIFSQGIPLFSIDD